jgi:hypothetical protein
VEPLSCPICNLLKLRRLLEEFKITASNGNGDSPVGGLLAYQCLANGHVFFVCVNDV